MHLKCYTIPVSPASQMSLILVAANISQLKFFARTWIFNNIPIESLEILESREKAEW